MEKGYNLSLSILFTIIVILTGILVAWLLRPVDKFVIDEIKVSVNSTEPTVEMFGAPKNKVIYYKDGEEINYADLGVGTYDVKVIVNNKEYKSKIHVYDDEKPVLTLKNVSVKYGEKYDINMFIVSCKDNSNLECNIKVSDEKMLGYTDSGEYDIEIIATDESGNVSTSTAKLNIQKKEEVNNNNNVIVNTNSNTFNNSNNTNTNNSSTGSQNNSTNNNTSSNNSSNNTNANISVIPANTGVINEVLKYVNQYRSEVGVSALVLDSRLNNAAKIRAGELAKLNSVSHTRPDGRSCFTVLSDLGISYGGAAENVAKGQSSASAVANTWRNSNGHYQNIINRNFSKVGISYVVSNNTYYWVMLFI